MNHLVITGGEGTLAKAIAAAFDDGTWDISAPSHGQMDVTNAEVVRGCLLSRPVDLLVCAAGLILDAPLARLSEKSWDQVLSVNYQGVLNAIGATLPQMLAARKGHIVVISSNSAKHPPSGQAAYAAAKAALLGLTADLAAAHGRNGIRVNAILPGFLETRMTSSVTASRREQILASHCLGRFNTPEITARFIRTLHENLPHTSGQVFQLDSRIG